MSTIRKLRQEHADLVEMVGRLSAIVAFPEPPPIIELYKLRCELAATLIGHLKAEDWALYPRLMASGDAQIAATAKAFSDEMGGLAAAFEVYTQRWNALSIQGNWHGFCLETKDIIAALTSRITRENRDLYPLIDRLDKAA
ncbi:MAG: hemerythrin domain-containing protein [Sphingomicrobium sp.]